MPAVGGAALRVVGAGVSGAGEFVGLVLVVFGGGWAWCLRDRFR